MFPNSPNASFTLIKIFSYVDTLGVKKRKIKSEKKVVGSKRSVTISEYNNTTLLNLNVDIKVVMPMQVYDGSMFVLMDEAIYKVVKTYVNGQFIELYLVLTETTYKELSEH